jgi:protein AbiQ
MVDQLRWCNDNRDLIRRKAAKLYDIVTLRPESARGLVQRCCDFKLLEAVLETW